jgi:hypothetical protein
MQRTNNKQMNWLNFVYFCYCSRSIFSPCDKWYVNIFNCKTSLTMFFRPQYLRKGPIWLPIKIIHRLLECLQAAFVNLNLNYKWEFTAICWPSLSNWLHLFLVRSTVHSFPLTASLSHIYHGLHPAVCLSAFQDTLSTTVGDSPQDACSSFNTVQTNDPTCGWELLKLTTVWKLDTSCPFQMRVRNVLTVRNCSPTDSNEMIICTGII